MDCVEDPLRFLADRDHVFEKVITSSGGLQLLAAKDYLHTLFLFDAELGVSAIILSTPSAWIKIRPTLSR
jgi:hypothetical protein